MLNAGIIGCGGIGRMHASAYAKLKDVKVAALIDYDLDRAEALAREFGGKACKTIDEYGEKLDLVSVVTPPAAHYSVVMDLLERGIPVFCEKPITMDIDQAKEIVKRSEETGIPVGVGFKMRYEPVFRKAKELLPQVGKVFAVSAVKNQPFGDEPGRQWIKSTGCMYELSVHDYDLIHYIMEAQPVKVRARLEYSLGWKREDQAYLEVEYSNGAIGQLMSSYSTETAWTGYDIALTFIGEKGYMRVERPDRIVLNTDKFQVVETEALGGLDVFVEQARSFVFALKNGIHYYPDVKDGAIGTILIESANQAHKIKEEVILRKDEVRPLNHK